MAVSLLKSSLVAALAATILTSGGLRFIQQSRAREAADLRRANDRMRTLAYQRRQMPAREAAAPVPDKTVGQVTAQEVGRSAPPASVPMGNYRNEGQMTPLAALQTFAWACDRGDSETVGRLLYLDETLRARAVAFMASLPAGTRARWHSPEEMVASSLVGVGIMLPFPGAGILEKATVETLGDERVRLRLPGTLKDLMEFQKAGDSWKYVVSEATLDDCFQQLSDSPPRGR